MAILDELKNMTFANRAEEAAWWEANEEAVADSFEKDLSEGYVGPCTVVVTGDSTTTKIRIGPRDIAKVHVQAGARGLRHQIYLKMIVHEALHNAELSRMSASSKKAIPA
jgi:predicted DNA binding CopG/RHH family protein